MNRLAQETSPYLRQHSGNPVDWFPWGDEAFQLAKERDVPILLSVGYSACHWCHVMAHESFEDAETATVMNGLFVNVKVDREERPDVDAVYMTAVQSMTGRGGWPMTVFMTPDGRPFHGGTYYPKADRHGLPGFVRLLHAVDDAWRNRRPDLLEGAGKLTDAVTRGSGLHSGSHGAEALTAATLDRATDVLLGAFDARLGGFGGAPKFPPGMAVDLLLRSHLRTGDRRPLDVAVQTLDAMAAGGLYDQVGGGFHRYSVDAFWLVPHFEKMLYDQATLTRAYLHAFQVTGARRHRRIVEETVGYVLRDLAQAGGGWSSAEDADSEGEEGRFYVWSRKELAEVAGADAEEAVAFWGVTDGGNFAEDPSQPPQGDNILHVPLPEGGLAALPGVMDRPETVERARAALFDARAGRIRPGLDDKVLTGWNAMFGSVLAEAAAVFDREDWLKAARANARFLLDVLRRPDGRVMRAWQGQPGTGTAGPARHLGYAEDYAALCGFLVTLAEVDDPAWLAPAREVADGLLGLFVAGDGSCFMTGHDAEPLIARPKDYFDNATPSANSLAAAALLRLGALTGEERYRAAATGALAAVGAHLGDHPTGFAEALGALDRALAPPLEVAVVGPSDDPATKALAGEVRRRFLPGAVSVVAAPGTGAEHTPLLADRPTVGGKPAAYVCEHFACRAPLTDPADLAGALDAVAAR